MDRIVLTSEEQAAADQYRQQTGVNSNDTVIEGTNLVVDDHLTVDNSWKVVVLSGDGGGAVNGFVPEWGKDAEGNYAIFPIDLVDYVTDRIGPQGQTMPIYNTQGAVPNG